MTGYKYLYNQFDGRKILVETSPGEIIKPDQIKTVEDLGMPFFKNPYKFGNLFMIFTVKFPERVNENQVKRFKEVIIFIFID